MRNKYEQTEPSLSAGKRFFHGRDLGTNLFAFAKWWMADASITNSINGEAFYLDVLNCSLFRWCIHLAVSSAS